MRRWLGIVLVVTLLLGLLPAGLATTSYKVLLDFEFNSSTLFGKKYDVDLYLNDQLLANLKHGTDYKETLDVNEGANTIFFYNHTDKSISGSIELDVQGNTKVSCWFTTKVNRVDINDVKIQALPDSYAGAIQTTPEELHIEEGEIAFRNIPWGTNYYTAAKEFSTSRYTAGLNIRPSMYMIEGLHDLVGWFPKINTKWSKLGECAIVYNPEMQAAGYDLNEINLYFAYVPDAYGDITRELKDSSLFAAVYDIKIPGEDYAKTIKDLKSKLSGIYGTNITESSEKTTDKKATYYIWKGKNDTYVCLCDSVEVSWILETRKITIVYASKKYEKKLIETDSILSGIDQANATLAPFEIDSNDGL